LRGARGHRAAEAAFRGGLSEYEIHTRYVHATGHTEAELPYPNIVALNEHAAVLHYQQLDRAAPVLRHSFLIDAGAEVGGYAADITRTYAHEDRDFQALVQAMHALQQQLCDQVRPGVDYVSIHLDAHLRIANLLREARLIKIPGEDAVARGVSGVFFPHGVGHLLGLQVHDVAGFSIGRDGRQRPSPAAHPYLRLTRILEPGFVVTIEPGLYFIEPLLERARAGAHADCIDWREVERLKPFGGIRIEDDVVCTSGAPENLTRPAFAKLADG
jgi:Xaa-Pro dipeptidase